MSKLLDRNEILALDDKRPTMKLVEVPEWGGSVHVRVMTGKERERLEAAFGRDEGNVRARLAAATVCDEDGKLLFSEADVVALGEKSILALHRIHEVAQRINFLTAVEVEGLEKNSGAAS